jgi:GAF domain-containing protein
MFQRLRKIIAAPVFEDDEKTYTARLLNVILWAGIVIFLIAGILTFAVSGQVISLVVLGALITVYLGLVYAMHQGYVKPVSYLVTLSAFTGITASTAISGGIFSPSSAAFITVTLIAGFLLGSRAGILVTFLSVLVTLGLAILGNQGLLPTDEALENTFISSWVTLTVIIFSTTTFFILAVQNLNNANKKSRNSETQFKKLTNELENRIREHTRDLELANSKNLERAGQLRAIAEISQTFTGLKNINELLTEITDQISQVLGFYHVGIYLLDSRGEYAILRATNSQGGQRMLEQGHRLKVGQMGIVGYVTSTGSPRIALDVGKDAIFFDVPELPETRSEIALPLRIGGNIIGALDVQSTKSAAFTDEDLDTLSLLAGQIAISIQNARLFNETRLALAEAQAASTQSSQAGWRDITQRGSFGYRFANGAIEPYKEQTAETSGPETTDRKPAAAAKASDFELLAIPISIRGEELGMLNIRQTGRSMAWADSEIRLYTSIVERLSSALENARLVEETNNRAERDRTITSIADKLGSSTRVESILRTAAEELSRVISGSEVLIQLQTGPAKGDQETMTPLKAA